MPSRNPPNVAIATASKVIPDVFKRMLLKCLDERNFPVEEPEIAIIILLKPGKPPGDLIKVNGPVGYFR